MTTRRPDTAKVKMTAAYERPVEGTLHVHLANGETWEATPEDLDRFGCVKRLDAYMAFDDTLRTVLTGAGLVERDVTDAMLNPVRYLVEIAVNHPSLLDHAGHRGWREVVELERFLAEHADEVRARLDAVRD